MLGAASSGSDLSVETEHRWSRRFRGRFNVTTCGGATLSYRRHLLESNKGGSSPTARSIILLVTTNGRCIVVYSEDETFGHEEETQRG